MEKSAKTRSNYRGTCTKECRNRGELCDVCFKWQGEYSHYEKPKEEK